MTTYYADIDFPGVGGDGSIGDPWTSESLLSNAYNVLPAGSIIKVKGSHDYGGYPFAIRGASSTAITIENWIAEPWRIKLAESFTLQNDSTVKGGIIDNSGSGYSVSTFKGNILNCYIKTDYIDNGGVDLSTYKGCTIITPLFSIPEYLPALNKLDVYDSIIDCPSFNSTANFKTYNCVFTKAILPTGTDSSSQVNWTPPSWPAWNDSQLSFSVSVLGVGINTPPEPGNPPYTDYTQGLWGSTRTGIGAMDFTQTVFYADLDLAGTGGTGTALDPFTADDFLIQAYETLPSGYTIKVKGSHAYTDNVSIKSAIPYGAITVENWISTPFRISTTLSVFVEFGSTFKNCIVNTPDTFTVEGTMLNCFIKADLFLLEAALTSVAAVIKGCTITLTSYMRVGNNTPDVIQGNFTDCILDTPSFDIMDNNITTARCVFTIGNIASIGTHTNAQVAWTAPSWPAWNAAQSAFDSLVLSAGILTPPQPGTSPYTGYTTGLWASARIGIGSMDFTTLPPVPTIGDRYLAKVTAHGWTKDYIYEFDGVQWTETAPVEGACVVVKQLMNTYTFLNAEWSENVTPWLDPVISIFNNTVALPVAPSNGDRYIALVTANGWTINLVYEWNSNTWVGTTPVTGMLVYNNGTSQPYLYTGGVWTPFVPLTAHAIGGPLHTSSTVTDIKTKVTGPDFLITSQQSEISTLPVKVLPIAADLIVIEDSADSNKKKQVTLGTVSPGGAAGGDLAGTYPNPTVAQISKSLKLTGVINDTIAAQKNNYDPLGLADASTIQLTMSGDQTITGLAGGSAGRIIIIQSGYTGSTDKLTLKNNSPSSLAANRFFCPLSTDFVLSDDNSVILQYDAVQNKWIVIATCQAPYGTTTNTICEGNDSRLSLIPWQWGTGLPPVVTSEGEGSLYFRYIP